jgi:hypothetical protein
MPCGCEFHLLDNKVKNNDKLPVLDIDFSNIRNCPMVWDMLEKGNTKGVFQLETSTGEQWSSKIKAQSIDDISALLSLIRPGVLKSMLNNKSLADHYVDRKNNGEHIEYISEHLEPILSETQGILLFQEQAIFIARDIAGFDPGEAETLRKSIGKKDSELMAKLKPKFMSGCEKVAKVTKEQAETIFSWLEESQKYSFNQCLDPTTTVETIDGLRLLKELKIGDFVNSPDGFIEVTDIIDQGSQDVYEIELESGHTINCTMCHKFMCRDGIIRPLYEILENDYEIIHD